MTHTMNGKNTDLRCESVRTRNGLPTSNESITEHDVNGIGVISNAANSLTAPSKVEERRKTVSEQVAGAIFSAKTIQ